MKSACVLLFLIGTLVVRGAIAQTPSCIGQPNGYTFNNPVSDNNYYICLNNVPIPIQCPVGYLFCVGATYCTSSCGAVIPPITAAPPTTVATTVATTAATTAATTQTTPTTTVATPAPVTTPATNVCTGQFDGTIFPHSTSCTSYLLCTNGVPVTGTCLASYSFDAGTGSCINSPC